MLCDERLRTDVDILTEALRSRVGRIGLLGLTGTTVLVSLLIVARSHSHRQREQGSEGRGGRSAGRPAGWLIPALTSVALSPGLRPALTTLILRALLSVLSLRASHRSRSTKSRPDRG